MKITCLHGYRPCPSCYNQCPNSRPNTQSASSQEQSARCVCCAMEIDHHMMCHTQSLPIKCLPEQEKLIRGHFVRVLPWECVGGHRLQKPSKDGIANPCRLCILGVVMMLPSRLNQGQISPKFNLRISIILDRIST